MGQGIFTRSGAILIGDDKAGENFKSYMEIKQRVFGKAYKLVHMKHINDYKFEEIEALYKWLEEENDRSKRRLYLCGHGEKAHSTLAGLKAADVLARIGDAGLEDSPLRNPPVKRLRLILCHGARASKDEDDLSDDVRLANSKSSFGSYLCRRIKDPELEVHANYYKQAVYVDNPKNGLVALKGIKRTEIRGNQKIATVEQRVKNTIVIFKYVGGGVNQRSVTPEWKEYAEEAPLFNDDELF